MASNGTSQNPPTLPPSVEESYKRKCIQLKTRMNEVEEANDAARLRLSRMRRAINKMRLERAFLLEQMSKRTSTNVEDSEGSPSPPPTVGLLTSLLPRRFYMIANTHLTQKPIASRKAIAHKAWPS